MLAGLFGIIDIFQNTIKPTIFLVNGAWLEVQECKDVAAVLRAKCFSMIAIHLPGHGNDSIPYASITLQSYVHVVEKEISTTKNVKLVGHSMAAMVISQVAEDLPERIGKLIYLAAYFPTNWQGLLDRDKTDSYSHVIKFLQIDPATASARIIKDGALDIFVADTTKSIQNQFANGVKADP